MLKVTPTEYIVDNFEFWVALTTTTFGWMGVLYCAVLKAVHLLWLILAQILRGFFGWGGQWKIHMHTSACCINLTCKNTSWLRRCEPVPVWHVHSLLPVCANHMEPVLSLRHTQHEGGTHPPVSFNRFMSFHSEQWNCHPLVMCGQSCHLLIHLDAAVSCWAY